MTVKYRQILSCIAVCIWVVFGFVGCRPRGVLSSGQMEDLFVDLHRADGIIYVNGYKYNHDSVVSLTYDSILAAHGVTRAQLDSSLVWYTDNPMLFDKIYPHVLDRLTALQEEERRRHEEEIRREEEELHKQTPPNLGKKMAPSPDAGRLLQTK